MIYYGNIAKNVYFGNDQRFHNIPTSPIILDFWYVLWYVYLRGEGYQKYMPLNQLCGNFEFCLSITLVIHNATVSSLVKIFFLIK